MKTFAQRIDPRFTFAASALLINIAASAIYRIVPTRTVAFAASFDMCVTVTAVYYWILVRPGLQPKASLLLIAFLGLLRASIAFPGAIPGRLWLSSLAELALLAGLVKMVRSGDGGDPIERMRLSLGKILPSKIARNALAGELAILYYAFAWRAKPHVPAGAVPFTLHKRSGFSDLIFFVALASLLEVVPVHLVVGQWSAVTAWVLTGVSLYAAIWAVALSRSFALRPCLLASDAIVLRFGLLLTRRIPLEEIACAGSEPVAGAYIVPRGTPADRFIRFRTPLEAERILGLKKRIGAVGFSADSPVDLSTLS